MYCFICTLSYTQANKLIWRVSYYYDIKQVRIMNPNRTEQSRANTVVTPRYMDFEIL